MYPPRSKIAIISSGGTVLKIDKISGLATRYYKAYFIAAPGKTMAKIRILKAMNHFETPMVTSK